MLLEAVTISIAGGLTVDGGSGGATNAGAGGAGATGASGPGSGTSFTAADQGGAGGGGAGGRIRINAPGTVCPSSVSPVASCSSGILPSIP